MKVGNTQIAAALKVLGYEILPSTDFSLKEVTFEFPDDPRIDGCKAEWKSYVDGTINGKPLFWMFKASKARQWILEQVIHGEHNAGLALPASTMITNNLDFAVCLVACGHYLLKLDKTLKVFHFSAETEAQRESFNNPIPESDYFYMREYLRALSQLVRMINNGRNLTRQQNQHVIPCTQP